VVATGDVADGGDTVYTVALAANDLLELDLVTTSTTAQVYILDACTDTTSCLAYKARLGAGKLYYLSPTAKTVSVVVDNTVPTATDAFTLSYRVRSGAICVPGASRCLDAMNALVCDGTGQAEDAVVCRDGCVGSLCADEPLLTDLCSDASLAPTIGEGISVAGQLSDHTNVFGLTSADCGNIGVTAGPDVFYRIALAPGEGVMVSATTPTVSEPTLYIMGDSCMTTTCRVGARGTRGAVSSFYINETMTTESLMVVLDTPTATTGGFALSIAKYFPLCTPGAVLCVDAMTSAVCQPDGAGFGAARSCALGCDPALGLCNAGPGDRCDVPVDLVSGVAVMGDLADYDISHPQTASCTGYSFAGRDGVWRLAGLMAGQRVKIDYTSTGFDGAIYVADSCANAAIGTCRAGVDRVFSNNTETLTYTMPAAGDLLIVAGSYLNTASSGTFSLIATVLP
jgi:hypothetical protein